MPLFFPPATTINRFLGGFKSNSDYTDLANTECNDARNVEYGPDRDITQRKGSLKLYNTALTSDGGTTARPITGHYYFGKLGASGVSVVMAGDSIFKYTSATASTIATSLTDNSATFWDTIQVQDPRSASDDVIFMTNGVDPIKLWNGSASAINLSAITSASGVPIAKYLLQHKNRVYAANITDSTDVDSPVKVVRSEIGSDGAPNPHRFVDEFYVGGSDKDGQIQAQALLSDQIIYYTKNSIWRFIPGLGDVNDLEKVVENVGLFAPKSLVIIGNLHIFLSERGIYSFDGSKVTQLSENIDDILLDSSNQPSLENAVAEYDYAKNQYVLYISDQNSTRNNFGLKFDTRLLVWQPPVSGREVNVISTFVDEDNRTRMIYGDYLGYLYRDGIGTNDGVETGFNGTITTGTFSVITTTASYPTDNDGLGGLEFGIISGTGEGQRRRIVSNTSNTLTLETPLGQRPDATSVYTVGAIDSYWRSKDFNFTGHDITKIFRYITLRLREEGQKNLNLHYIVNFNKLPQATLKLVEMLKDAWVWGKSRWGQDSWGRRQSFSSRVSLRNTNTQKLNGTHLAVRVGNRRANEEFQLVGMDIEMQQLGKR